MGIESGREIPRARSLFDDLDTVMELGSSVCLDAFGIGRQSEPLESTASVHRYV
jgi:hypothetical protein